MANNDNIYYSYILWKIRYLSRLICFKLCLNESVLLERMIGAGKEFHTEMMRLKKKNLCVLVLASGSYSDFERVAAQVTIWIKSEERFYRGVYCRSWKGQPPSDCALGFGN